MKSKNYIGICVSLIFIIIMFILRFWTDIDSSFYILFFFPSIIVFPYSDKTFIYRIIYITLEYNPYPFIIRTLGRFPDFEVTNCQPFLLLYSALICFLGNSI